jgi:ABC-type multidrug transport system fused ATPase/permease subunit
LLPRLLVTDDRVVLDDSTKSLVLPDVWRDARELVVAHRGRLTLGLILLLVGRAASLVLPATSKYLVDDVFGKGRQDLLPLLAAAAIGAAVVQSGTTFALARILGVTAHRAITDLRKRLEQHVVRLPIATFDRTNAGTLTSRIMSDAEGIRNLVGTGLVQLARAILTAGLALCVLFYLHWALTLILVVALATFGVCVGWTLRRIRPLFRERAEISARVTGRLGETLSGIRVVKSYGAEGREDLVFARGAHDLFRNMARIVTGVSSVNAFTTVMVGVGGAIMLVVGGRAVLGGSMTLGDFVMYVFFVGLLSAHILTIASIGPQISEAFAGLDRIRETLSQPTEFSGEPTRQSAGPLVGDVQFEHVSFEYRPSEPVLRSVTFAVPAGTTTALIGSSGSGKSTILSLVMAWHRPTSGRVLIDGHDLSELSLRDYRSRLGVVLQENFLFDGSIADNIRYGRPDATDQEMLEVARIAHIDEFVEPLSTGFDTVVGDRGVKLSAGQRQRIAIARALLVNPAILILDEATSSLDSETEDKVRDAMEALRRDRTTLVIAHRLSTIRSADQILVLEKGEIVQRGQHDALLAQAGRYRELYARWSNLQEDRFANPGEDLSDSAAAGSDHESTVPSASQLERDLVKGLL